MFDFTIHSPIQEIKYNVPEGYQLFIKRDDLIDPLISGNKWRKLKYHLIEAKHQQKKILVSFGGAYSNHLLALASAAAKFEFQAIAFIRGDEHREKSTTEILCESLGMQLIRVSRADYQHKKTLFDKYFSNNNDAYFIDEGGNSALGVKGCEELIDELHETYSNVFIAAGTGCTSAGILKGIQKNNLKTHLHSVVVHSGIDEIHNTINNYATLSQISILDTQRFGRYAKHTDELLAFCIDFQKNTGILLDVIYTAKALFTCYDWMKTNKTTPQNSKILFIHTGGILGNMGKIQAFNDFNKNRTS